jgi:hypothetical protein
MVLTRHAIKRFQERVRPVSAEIAARLIRDAADRSPARPTPRWWTPVRPAPGRLFLYPATMPGVCFLVRDGAIVTVLERSQCRSWARAPRDSGARIVRRPYQRPPPGADLLEAA